MKKTPTAMKYSGKGNGVLGGPRHSIPINSADAMNFDLKKFHAAKGKAGFAAVEKVINRKNKSRPGSKSC